MVGVAADEGRPVVGLMDGSGEHRRGEVEADGTAIAGQVLRETPGVVLGPHATSRIWRSPVRAR